jgi:hypothetical protein
MPNIQRVPGSCRLAMKRRGPPLMRVTLDVQEEPLRDDAGTEVDQQS